MLFKCVTVGTLFYKPQSETRQDVCKTLYPSNFCTSGLMTSK